MTDSRARLWGIFGAACVAGVVSGLMGVGGGVLLVPLLVLLFAFEQHRAQGTSLVALVPPTGLFAFLAYARAHYVDWNIGLLVLPGVFLGGMFGGRLAGEFSGRRLRRVFAAFLFVLGAWQMFSAWKQ